MNFKIVGRIIGMTILIEAGFMIVPMLLCLYDVEPDVAVSFAIPIVMMLAVGALLLYYGRRAQKNFYVQESFVATGLSWVAMSFFGALPFWMSRQIPSFVDALFEIVSGFTTTGASILLDVEALSRGILYWRSFSHWLGGMGVLVFLLALVPAASKVSGYNMHLLRAESPGPSVGKLTPRLRHTAIILYGLYITLTVLCVLFLLAGGMPLFESLCTAYGTAGTGGFGVKNTSLGGYSTYLQAVVTIFMFLFGVNFSLYFLLLLRQFGNVWRDEELRLYAGVTLGAILLITFDIRGMFETLGQALHHAAFQVSSIITTTGFSTVDFELWPSFSKSILLVLMCFGACAGSTGGGLKIARILLLLKAAHRNIQNVLHPRRVQVVQVNGQTVDEQVLHNVNAYLSIYCMLCFGSFILISVDGFSMGTNISAVLACFNNIGPGFELVGATANYSIYSNFSKIILILDMLLGRLEIFPILVLFSKKTWSRLH